MTAKRDYYVGEGPEVEAFLTELKLERDKFYANLKLLSEKYGAEHAYIKEGHIVVGLGFADDLPRPGFKLEKQDGIFFGRPSGRSKVANAIVDDFARHCAPGSVSNLILKRYDAERMVPQSDPASRTGMSLAVSVAGPIKGWKRLVLSVPVCDEQPFAAPPGLKQIKKSEFIAITEEGA